MNNRYTNTNPEQVVGYEITETIDDSAALYCVTVAGDVFTTGFRPRTKEVRDNFKVHGDIWTRCDALPEQAYYIGRYALPLQLLGTNKEKHTMKNKYQVQVRDGETVTILELFPTIKQAVAFMNAGKKQAPDYIWQVDTIN